jgi:hypothetical protein
VEVEMPTGLHVLDFEAPDFAGSEMSTGFHATLLEKTWRCHLAAQRAVRENFVFAE